MRLLTFIAAALLPAVAQASEVCPYKDIMPEVSAFAADTAGMAPAERADAFVSRIVDRHPDYYAERLFGSRERLAARALRLFDPERTPNFPGVGSVTLDRVLKTGEMIGTEYRRIEAEFRQAFPDYRCETPISFGPSLFLFDGNQSSAAPGQAEMRFGVDMIALLHPPHDLKPFFQHELFHIYQAQQIGEAEPPEATQPLWWALWSEGLASYVSWELNPDLTSAEIFWLPRDMEAQMEKKLPQAARLLLAELDGHEGYGRWFTAGENPPDLPPRAGYYLGYLMAKRLDAGDLAALARMPPAQVQREAHAFLQDLATQPDGRSRQTARPSE